MLAATVINSCSHSRLRVRSPAFDQPLLDKSLFPARRRMISIMCQAATSCHYQVLGVEPTASADEIKRAFRKLALQLHPDVNSSGDAADAFKTAKSAYEVLSDPQQRAAYNNTRKRQARTYSGSTSSAWPGNSSRTRATQQQQSRRSSVEYVVYDFGDIEEGDIDAANAGFYGWYAQSGSWQSSWEANKKKQQRRQRQQQQQRRQAQGQQQGQAVAELLQQQDPQTLGVVAQVFGEQLENLSSIQELLDLLAGLEFLYEEGVGLDASTFRTTSSNNTDTGGSSSSSGTRRGTHRQQTRPAAGQTGSSSSRQRQAGTSSQSRRGNTSSSRQPSSSSSSSSSRSGMPRFAEMGFDELFAAMNDAINPKVAQAARDFARQHRFADPALAADVEAFLTLEFLSGDWDDSSVFTGLGANSSSSSWQHASFDYGEYAARQKYRAKPGSARDYVRYEADDDDAEQYADEGEVIHGNFGFVDMDDVIMQTGWGVDVDDD